MKYFIRPTKELKRGAMVYLSTDTHPHIVVSCDEINQGIADYCIVCPLTSRHTHLHLPGRDEVTYKSVVCADKITTVPKHTIQSVCSVFTPEQMKIVDKAITESLGMVIKC